MYLFHIVHRALYIDLDLMICSLILSCSEYLFPYRDFIWTIYIWWLCMRVRYPPLGLPICCVLCDSLHVPVRRSLVDAHMLLRVWLGWAPVQFCLRHAISSRFAGSAVDPRSAMRLFGVDRCFVIFLRWIRVYWIRLDRGFVCQH